MDSAQGLRLRRTSLALLFALIQTLYCWILFYNGYFRTTQTQFILLYSVFWLGYLLFPLLIITRINKRFTDPSMTVPQMSWYILCYLICVYLTNELRHVISMFGVVIIVFGVLGLNARQLIFFTIGIIVLHAAVIYGLYLSPGIQFNVKEEFLDSSIFSLVIMGCSIVTYEFISLKNRLRLQYLISKILSESEDLESSGKFILQTICKKTGWALGNMWVVDANNKNLSLLTSWHDPEIKVEDLEKMSGFQQFDMSLMIPGQVLNRKDVLEIEDISKKSNFVRQQYVGQAAFHGAIGIPIMYVNEVLGVLEFFSKKKYKRNKGLVETLWSVASQVGILFSRKQSEKILIDSETKYRQLIEYSPFGIIIEASDTIMFVNESMASLLQAKDASVIIGRSIFEIIHPDFHGAFKKRKRYIMENQIQSETIEEKMLTMDGHEIEVEVMSLPQRYEGRQALQIIVNDISERKQAESQIRHMVYHDPLTGLNNRMKLESEINRTIMLAKLRNESFGVLLIDIDNFKNINDTLGHDAGDLVIREMGRRLQNCIRTKDTLARLGGDEFAILAGGLTDTILGATTVAKKIMQTAAPPFYVKDQKLQVTISVGIGIYPDNGDTVTDLLKNAEIAMYFAKEGGKNNFQFSTTELIDRVYEKTNLEKKLRVAIGENQFIVHYQPKVSLKTGAVIGVEALIRWNKPDEGMIFPDKFIPVLEETGLVVPLLNILLQNVCDQTKLFEKENLPPLPIAINLSARNFQEKDLVDNISKILKENNVDPSLLEIEITEGTLMRNIENNIQALVDLKKMGVSIAIDDFGVGYSSLSYLKSFVIDKIKIDQSFIKNVLGNLNDASIVSAIIAMAHSLNILVIAEGVETKEQLQFLIERKCDEMQGYYFSKAINGEDVIHLIKSGVKLEIK